MYSWVWESQGKPLTLLLLQIYSLNIQIKILKTSKCAKLVSIALKFIFKIFLHTCFVFLPWQSSFIWKFPALHFILLPKAHNKNLCSDSSGVCSMDLGELPDNKRKRYRLEEK